ncbi:hypothetical protein ABES08_12580 [Peribacillus simplex]|uniref:hypothetical protein n=1 Tax=Peribacillus simplex TaxID=1478 RepID=UPI003D28E118
MSQRIQVSPSVSELTTGPSIFVENGSHRKLTANPVRPRTAYLSDHLYPDLTRLFLKGLDKNKQGGWSRSLYILLNLNKETKKNSNRLIKTLPVLFGFGFVKE